MSDFANRLRKAEDYGNRHLEKLHIAAAEEIDRLTKALSEAEQRVKDARRVAIEDAANIVGTLAEAFTRIGEHPEADSKKAKEFSVILEISSIAIRSLRSEERKSWRDPTIFDDAEGRN